MTGKNCFLAIVFTLGTTSSLLADDLPVSPSLLFDRNMYRQASKTAASDIDASATVTIRFDSVRTATQVAEIESHGVSLIRIEGRLMNTGTIYPARIIADSLETVAALPGVVYIEDSRRFARIPTLDVSNPLVQGEQAWSLRANGLPVNGSGVIVADVDTGINIYHPAFFKPDGGTYQWIDVDGNGEVTGGVDAVDLNGDGFADSNETLAYIDAYVTYKDAPGILDNEHAQGRFDAGFDWLYNDTNANGSREYGHDFGEHAPSYGEPFFVIDDANDNDRLDAGETLTMLGTSKVLAVYDTEGVHRRGVNLLTVNDDTVNHGTPAAGIVLGQTPGRKFTGIAPGAEIIAVNRTGFDDNYESIAAGIRWAVNEGADIVMYEFGSWVGEFLDGTSNFEALIDSLYAEGIHQFTASGNLAGPSRKKHVQFDLDYNEQRSVPFFSPGGNIRVVQLSILWRANRFRTYSPSVQVYLNDTTSRSLSYDGDPHPFGDYFLMSGRTKSPDTSSNTVTSRIDLVIYTQDELSVIDDTFSLKLTWGYGSDAPKSFDIYIADNVSGWMGGAQFTDESIITDDGTVTAPGTSIKGITTGAFTPRAYRSRSGNIGDIADFSGWGNTVDDRRAVDITAPSPVVFTAFSPMTVTQQGSYYEFSGTSAALPFAAGCAALIVQAAPDITPDDLYTVLTQFARQDEFTGFGDAIPNNTWGYGKLTVFDALVGSDLAQQTIVEEHPATFSLSAPYPNPFNGVTSIDVSSSTPFHDTFEADVYNLIGQKVRTLSVSLHDRYHGNIGWDGCDDNGNTVSTGIYLIRISANASVATARVVYLK